MVLRAEYAVEDTIQTQAADAIIRIDIDSV
jgi:hypothetical protein